MIRFRERDWRQEAAEGVLYFRVSGGCQRAQRMNENVLEAAVPLVFMKGSRRLMTWGSRGPRLVLDLPTYLGMLCLQKGSRRVWRWRHVVSVVSLCGSAGEGWPRPVGRGGTTEFGSVYPR